MILQSGKLLLNFEYYSAGVRVLREIEKIRINVIYSPNKSIH